MNPTQAIAKCNKKAWQEIKSIKSSRNMIQVEDCIRIAIDKTFGLYNSAMYIIAMRKLGKIDEAHRVMAIRNDNFDRWYFIVRGYLIARIPQRLHTTTMFKQYTGKLPVQSALNY